MASLNSAISSDRLDTRGIHYCLVQRMNGICEMRNPVRQRELKLRRTSLVASGPAVLLFREPLALRPTVSY
jgi:hypothetical protein